MFYEKLVRDKFCSGVLLLLLLVCVASASSCAKPALDLPKDILGVAVGMDKAAADARLREIAKFDREERDRKQVWHLKDNSRFNTLAVAFDDENHVRYIAGIFNESGANKMHYADVGDLSRSQQDVSQGNYKYVWDAAASGATPSYQVILRGNKPDYPMVLTLNKTGGRSEEEEEREREERKGK